MIKTQLQYILVAKKQNASARCYIYRLYTEVEVYMGTWIPRAKPEESKLTYAPKTKVYNRFNSLVPKLF